MLYNHLIEELIKAIKKQRRFGKFYSNIYGGFISPDIEEIERIPFSFGDDLKYIDWKIYAKTKKLYKKITKNKLISRSAIIIDSSRSMYIDNKLKKALEIGLNIFEAERIITRGETCIFILNSKNILKYYGNTPAHLIIKDIKNVKPEGEFKNIEKHIETLRNSYIYFISDMYIEGKYLQKVLNLLKTGGNYGTIIHLISPSEFYITSEKVYDVETKDIAYSSNKYKDIIREYSKKLEKEAKKMGFKYISLTAKERENALEKIIKNIYSIFYIFLIYSLYSL